MPALQYDCSQLQLNSQSVQESATGNADTISSDVAKKLLLSIVRQYAKETTFDLRDE